MARGKHRRPRTNKLTRGVVAAGTGTVALALPLLSATGASAAAPAQAPAAAPAPSQLRTITYTAVKGDSLYGIADKYDTPGGWRQLYKDNRKAIGDNPRLIHAGLKLTVRTTKTASATATKAAPSATASKPSSVAHATQASAKTYADNLDGWIRESLDVMA